MALGNSARMQMGAASAAVRPPPEQNLKPQRRRRTGKAIENDERADDEAEIVSSWGAKASKLGVAAALRKTIAHSVIRVQAY